MDFLFSAILYLLFGFFGLIFLAFVLALLFGKRIKKEWEYEADFRDEAGREFGEFECEMSKIVKQEQDFTFKAEFSMRHESIEKGQMIEVYVEDTLVLQGNAIRDGRAWLDNDALVNEVSRPSTGQICRVVWGGQEQFQAPLAPD